MVSAFLLIAAAWAVWPRPEPRRAAVPAPFLDDAPDPIRPSPYRNTDPAVKYVGDDVCSRCHESIANEFRGHPMGRSMTAASAAEPKAEGVVLRVADLEYSVERRDGRVFHRETRRDPSGREVSTEAHEVPYALGTGARGVAFLAERDGSLFLSPLGWFTSGPRWDLNPGYRTRNEHFDRPVTAECLFCHANRVERAGGKDPVFHGLAIGCERCHGPGALHAERQETRDGRDLTIVNPADLSPVLRDSVCQQCHVRGISRTSRPGRSLTDYRPGLRLDDFLNLVSATADPLSRSLGKGQVEQMKESRCYEETEGQLGCISCHAPHRKPAPSERVAFYRDRCLKCHSHQPCSLPEPTRLSRNPQNDCVACHMPRNPASDAAHVVTTLHSIPRIAPSATTR
ncbi:MAG: multiheme c-type cytochrome [Isosphaeraceae bacterium]